MKNLISSIGFIGLLGLTQRSEAFPSELNCFSVAAASEPRYRVIVSSEVGHRTANYKVWIRQYNLNGNSDEQTMLAVGSLYDPSDNRRSSFDLKFIDKNGRIVPGASMSGIVSQSEDLNGWKSVIKLNGKKIPVDCMVPSFYQAAAQWPSRDRFETLVRRSTAIKASHGIRSPISMEIHVPVTPVPAMSLRVRPINGSALVPMGLLEIYATHRSMEFSKTQQISSPTVR